MLDPLDILTGEGLSGAAALTWPSYEASGESNLVASGVDKVGELDPGEVRHCVGVWSPLREFGTRVQSCPLARKITITAISLFSVAIEIRSAFLQKVGGSELILATRWCWHASPM